MLDVRGRIVFKVVRDGSIDLPDLRRAIWAIGQARNMVHATCLLDNLRLHYNSSLNLLASKQRVNLIHNGTYSSELNPAEQVFALSKRTFRRRIHEQEGDLNQKVIRDLVKQCIEEVP